MTEPGLWKDLRTKIHQTVDIKLHKDLNKPCDLQPTEFSDRYSFFKLPNIFGVTDFYNIEASLKQFLYKLNCLYSMLNTYKRKETTTRRPQTIFRKYFSCITLIHILPLKCAIMIHMIYKIINLVSDLLCI